MASLAPAERPPRQAALPATEPRVREAARLRPARVGPSCPSAPAAVGCLHSNRAARPAEAVRPPAELHPWDRAARLRAEPPELEAASR